MYEELFKKLGENTVNVRSYCTLRIEIFKTPNNINPSFIKKIFRLPVTHRPIQGKHKFNLEIQKSDQVRFGR